ncbi:MAG: hypothetical protein ACLUIQ_02965 [Dialister invisus]
MRSATNHGRSGLCRRPVLIKAETSERISDNGTFVEPKRRRIMLAMRKTASMVKRAERLSRLFADFYS